LYSKPFSCGLHLYDKARTVVLVMGARVRDSAEQSIPFTRKFKNQELTQIMKTAFRALGTSVLGALLSFASPQAQAQKAPAANRIVESVNDAQTVTLRGNVHPLARPQYDRGVVSDSQPLNRMMLLLQKSPTQETALRQLLDAQQSKGSASFHTWLTPEQYGKQFGPSDADLQTVTDWLTRQGFAISKVSAGRTVIEFSGNVAQVRNAFHTEMHKFVVNGEARVANVSDPQIPAALSPVVAGVVALHNFPKRPQSRRVGTFQKDLSTGQVKPLFTYTDAAGTFYGVGPGDFRTIYNVPSAATGANASIAIVGQSNINIQDVRDFRTMFGLAANDPTIIVNGPDPGLVDGDEGESDLDIELAGAIAPAANIIFVTSQGLQSNANQTDTQISEGIDLSALYIVDNNVAPIMSESYGACEASLGTAGNQFYSSLWQQAAAEGITVVLSSGDTGSAGCDSLDNGPAATNGVNISGLASTPYNLAIGGTDFNQFNIWSTYWNTSNDPTTQTSAKNYIPETPWNDSPCAVAFPTVCTTVAADGSDLSAGAGGPSNCVVLNSSGTTCTTNSTFPNGGYVKPPFQTGAFDSGDSVRDIPDLSLFAGDGVNGSFYIVCQSDVNPGGAACDLSTSTTSGTHNFSGVGGTSGAAPTFAAIMALVNAQTGQRQGNANYVLYALAALDANYASGACNASAPATGCVFNDVNIAANTNQVAWNNSVACVGGSPNCSQSSGFGILVLNNNPAFVSAKGYDLSTGLGSVNVTNLLAKWATAVRTPTTTAVSAATGGSPSGTAFSATITVAPAPTAADAAVSLNALDASKNVLASFGPFVLKTGTISAQTSLLPVGTAFVSAYYGGDATHAGSASAAVPVPTVTGSGNTGKLSLYFVSFNGTTNQGVVLNTSSQKFAYGTAYILSAFIPDPNSSKLSICAFATPATKPPAPCPTGAVTFTDNGQPLNDFPQAQTPNATNVANFNNLGYAEDQPIALTGTVGTTTPGVHTIVATYAGDANYAASTSNSLSITIQQASTSVQLFSSLGTITPGASVQFTAYVVTNSNSNGPTGTIQFMNGTTALGSPVTCIPTSAAQNTNPPNQNISAGTAYCTATTTAVISSLYPPPTAEPKTPGVPTLPILAALLSLVFFALGLRWMPSKRRRAYAYAGLVAFVLLTVGIAGCGGGGGSSGTTTRTINAVYSGDANYTTSTGSGTITVQ
jgi:Pro-kumamolisin, activation domain/Bacterial Ig-like domain (group 3)